MFIHISGVQQHTQIQHSQLEALLVLIHIETMALLAGESVSTSNKGLLELERKSTPLENQLLVCKNGRDVSNGKNSKREPPTIQALPQSSVLGRIKSFLPALDQANRKLFAAIEERGAEEFNIEATDAEERYVEMDLSLGVADLHTPEAVAAAALEATGQGLQLRCGESKESSDSDENSSETDTGDFLKVRPSERDGELPRADQDCGGKKSPSKRRKIEVLQ